MEGNDIVIDGRFISKEHKIILFSYEWLEAISFR
jgi:hypothetical protein